MPRKQIPLSSELPYHISVRCNNKMPFPLPIEEVWITMEDYLYFLRHSFDVRILAFVLMDNHFHLLAIFPQANIAPSMNYFLRETSRRIGKESGTINHLYKSRYHKTLVDSYRYSQAVYKYVYQNPVRAGICQNVEDYRYSTIHGLLGKSNLYVPVEEDRTLLSSTSECVRWLNEQVPSESTEQIRRALKHPRFELKKDQTSGKIHELDKGYFLF